MCTKEAPFWTLFVTFSPCAVDRKKEMEVQNIAMVVRTMNATKGAIIAW